MRFKDISNASDRDRILVVDDSPAAVCILEETFKGEYFLSTAANGLEALAAVERERPDLILLDVSMPFMDGYEVCRRLKGQEHTRDIPVIFITANEALEDEVRAFEVGGVDFVPKPIRPAVVKARVKTQMEMKRLRNQLESKVFVDDLTRLENRRCFNETLDLEWRRGIRTSQCLSLIMMDIDCFKQYNDTYGHTAGDECLRQVAQALKKSFQRASDLVARYGGEEFAALLPGTDHTGAVVLAGQVRENVAALHIPHRNSSAADHVTISLGVATLCPSRTTTPESLVDAADAMLYLAKQRGRNRVMGRTVGRVDRLPEPNGHGPFPTRPQLPLSK